jgi:arginase family enzyme
MSQDIKKVFGVALDASDDPWSLQLKWASMMAPENSADSLFSDPYDALLKYFANLQQFELAGKFPIPSWLCPRPQSSDRHLVNAKNLQHFAANGGLLETMKRLRDFVERAIFPAFPVMLGIDHSATGGVISALAQRYGTEMLTIVVLDRHFDAIPLSLRTDGIFNNTSGLGATNYSVPGNIMDGDQYCCGNFWAYLINGGVVLPENLLFVGVADYPNQKNDFKWQRLKEEYLRFEERGCNFFPLWKFDGFYIDSLTSFLDDKITTPYLYVSLDLDVGSCNCTYAARYMDGLGVNKQNILDVAGIIKERSIEGSFKLVGFDIMEFNMHFLGIKTVTGDADSTLALVQDFIETLTFR